MKSSLTIGLALVACALAGCHDGGHPATSAHDNAPAAAVEEQTPVEATPEMQAVLAKADLADGTEDHVVAKCPGCSLAMDGSGDHAMQVGEYALHFCSDSCKQRFGEHTAEAVLALAVPEGEPAEATP